MSERDRCEGQEVDARGGTVLESWVTPTDITLDLGLLGVSTGIIRNAEVSQGYINDQVG